MSEAEWNARQIAEMQKNLRKNNHISACIDRGDVECEICEGTGRRPNRSATEHTIVGIICGLGIGWVAFVVFAAVHSWPR